MYINGGLDEARQYGSEILLLSVAVRRIGFGLVCLMKGLLGKKSKTQSGRGTPRSASDKAEKPDKVSRTSSSLGAQAIEIVPGTDNNH